MGFQSTTPQDPWTLVLNGTPRKIDVGAVTWDDAEEVFVVMAGMGMDARMMGDADERIKNAVGWPAYLLSGVRALFDPGFTVRASTRDQQEESHRARMVVVGNCGQLTINDRGVSVHRLTPGFVLSSRFCLLERVASGGMGEVWAATDLVLERKVALKLTHPQTPGHQTVAERFKAEAKYAAQLSHPNIVEVFDFGEYEGLTYLVMEFIEGPTLAEMLATDGPLAGDRVRTILLQLAGALARAHENGIVHRDVKPANVIVSPDGYAKLMDFGIAKDVDAQTDTLPGAVLGTTHYVSPEQALGQVVKARSDLYSLGVLGHELLTGAKPFDRRTPIATALAHVADPPPPLPPDVPADLAEVIMACLAKVPEERPSSAAEVVRLLVDKDEDATVSLVLADYPTEDPVVDHVPT